jgi:hypothetical protein
MYQPGQRAKAFFQQTKGLKPDETVKNKLVNTDNVFAGQTQAVDTAAKDVNKATGKVGTVNSTFNTKTFEDNATGIKTEAGNRNISTPIVADNGNYNRNITPGYTRTDMDLINEKQAEVDRIGKIDLSDGGLDPLKAIDKVAQTEKSNFVQGANTFGETRNKEIDASLGETKFENMGQVGQENVVEQDANQFYKLLAERDPSNIGLLANLFRGYDSDKYGAVDSNVLQGILGQTRGIAEQRLAERSGAESSAAGAVKSYDAAVKNKRAEVANNYKGYQAKIEEIKGVYDSALATIKEKLDAGVITLQSARDQKAKIEGELGAQKTAMEKKVAEAKIEAERLAREEQAAKDQAKKDSDKNIASDNTALATGGLSDTIKVLQGKKKNDRETAENIATGGASKTIRRWFKKESK